MNQRTLCSLALFALFHIVKGRSVSYDQRQEGEVNVQIDVKDLRIVALMDSDLLDDYANYDYAYDYADFTIKPRPTPSKPTTASSVSSTSPSPSPTSNSQPDESSTIKISSSTEKIIESTSAKAPEALNSSTEPPSTKAPVSLEKLNSSIINSMPPEGSSPIIIIGETNITDASKIIQDMSSIKKTEEEKQQLANESTTINTNSTASEIKLDGIKRPAGHPEPRKRCPWGFLLKSGRCFKRRLSLIS